MPLPFHDTTSVSPSAPAIPTPGSHQTPPTTPQNPHRELLGRYPALQCSPIHGPQGIKVGGLDEHHIRDKLSCSQHLHCLQEKRRVRENIATDILRDGGRTAGVTGAWEWMRKGYLGSWDESWGWMVHHSWQVVGDGVNGGDWRNGGSGRLKEILGGLGP